MASPKSVLSQTLQNITLSKIRELESRHKVYEERKSVFLTLAHDSKGELERVECLLKAVRELYPAASRDHNLRNIERWLAQSAYDASIPESTLVEFSRRLRTMLDIQSRKFSMAHLYSRLLTEWMNQPPSENPSSSADDPDADSFEVVERQRQRLSELVDKFESVVFEPLETDEVEMCMFLDDLFQTEESRKELEKLRAKIADVSAKFWNEPAPFNPYVLTNTIKGLLTEDILSDEKHAILQDFLKNDVAKAEIADVLNMRFSDLQHWQWDAGEEGIRVMPRRGLNGKYRVWADDDILQMIFVQYIGIRLCNMLKSALKDFMRAMYWRNVPGHMAPSHADVERYRFYHNDSPSALKGVEEYRKNSYFDKFFLSQLPATDTSLFDQWNRYDDDDDGGNSAPKKSSGIKQQLLRHLTAELITHRLRGVTHDTRDDPKGPVALVQTDLQWYATGLSHSTIYAVMRYVNFDRNWIAFFKKYLEAPLNLDNAADDRPKLGPRLRKRGVPMAHSSEKFTGELVLFFMDLAVHRKTGILLYRLHDDIWLVGEPTQAAQAWSCMETFARVFGLEFNKAKTGSVYLPGAAGRHAEIAKTLPQGPVKIGFLVLDPESGKWIIDQDLVVAHVDQLKKQLSESRSVLSWVQTWNSCIGRFFSHTFGEPANCFGREHVDKVLDTYKAMLQRLFPGSDGKEGSVVEHIKQMIQTRFNVTDLPDSFIYLPEHLGGLGLRNPFVNLFLIRDEIRNPDEIIHEFLDEERSRWLAKKKAFEGVKEADLKRRLWQIYPDDDTRAKGAIKDAELTTFYSLDEFARFRERWSTLFKACWDDLTEVPETEEISLNKGVKRSLDEFLTQHDGGARVDAEKKWFLELYSRDLQEKYGGVALVDKQFLPVGVLTMMRGKKVSWNMVL
ncbi:hypothetical protein VTJ49DRAFT_5745 [Mycothermus thermophilus]|uniref:Reverse transcriptase n=1 Tax=Humicola insolens TaxID=85995 RepID=A0ABR3V2I2_HUMIN